MMVQINWFATKLSRFGGYAAAVIMVMMIAHILLEIFLRNVLSTSTYVLDEFVGYGTAAMTFLAAAYALQEGNFIRVNILLNRLQPSGASRRVIETLCTASTLAVVALLTGYFLKSVIRNFYRGATSETVSEIPLWIPEGVVALGLIILSLRLFIYLINLINGGELFVSGEDIPTKHQTDKPDALNMGER